MISVRSVAVHDGRASSLIGTNVLTCYQQFGVSLDVVLSGAFMVND